VHKLLDKGYETHLLKAVLAQVETRRFDTVIEYAYNHFLDVVQKVRQLPSASSSSENNSINTSLVAPDVMELCKQFVDAIDSIKDA